MNAIASSDQLHAYRLDAPFGVEVTGLRWHAPNQHTVKFLTQMLRRHLLIVFRGQPSPTHDELEEFFAPFGNLVSRTIDGTFHYKTFSADEQVMVHRRENFNYVVNTDEGASELVWHCDHFQRPQLKILSVLEAIDVEEGAKPTWYRDMYTAYEMLPAEDRALLAYKQTANYDPRTRQEAEKLRLCDSMHPVFTPHPQSGRVTLYVNGFTARIVGFNKQTSDALLARLRNHAEETAPVYVHHWRPGDLLVWDNVGLQHRRDKLPPGQRRKLRAFEGVAE